MSGMAIKRNKNKPEIQKTTFFTLLLGLFTVILPSFFRLSGGFGIIKIFFLVVQ